MSPTIILHYAVYTGISYNSSSHGINIISKLHGIEKQLAVQRRKALFRAVICKLLGLQPWDLPLGFSHNQFGPPTSLYPISQNQMLALMYENYCRFD